MSEQYVQPVIELDNSWGDRENMIVLCPVCRYEYQHHRDVAVFGRKGEDGLSYNRGPASDESRAATLGNPSMRRDGLRIEFDGECGHTWFLEIVQHKGQTFVFATHDPDDAQDSWGFSSDGEVVMTLVETE